MDDARGAVERRRAEVRSAGFRLIIGGLLRAATARAIASPTPAPFESPEEKFVSSQTARASAESWIVVKFGGTSVSTRPRWENIRRSRQRIARAGGAC